MIHFRNLLLLLIIALALSSCGDDLTNSKFIEGKIIYRAEADFPIGLIKLEEIFNEEGNASNPLMESPSRAVLYKFDAAHPYNLYEPVWFQIIQCDEYQYAKDITNIEVGSDSLMSDREKFKLLQKIHFNLHNGDKHREGPKHKRIHVSRTSPDGPAQIDTLFDHPTLTKIEVIEVETMEKYPIVIRTSEIPEFDDLGNMFYIQFEVQIDTNTVFSLDLNHIH